MMSLRRIFGLILLFLFFEAVVAVVTTFAYPEVNVFLACVAMTGLAVGVWAVFVLVTRLMMRPRVPSSPPLPRPANPVTPRPSFADDGFSQELNSLVAEANRRLAGALPLNARGEPATVATLPFYLMIGGEGVGKTSAILNSGLEPRLLAGEAAREGTVVPTRLCNLWFAEAVEYAKSVEPRRMRIPAIVPLSESRWGSNRIAPKVRLENSSINVWYRDSLAGAFHTSTALATIEKSAAVHPTMRACRRKLHTTTAPSHGAAIDAPVKKEVRRTHPRTDINDSSARVPRRTPARRGRDGFLAGRVCECDPAAKDRRRLATAERSPIAR